MNRKALDVPAIIAYLSWPGWLIALFVRDRSSAFTTHHMNQALILNIASVIAGLSERLPVIGGIVFSVLSLGTMVLWIMGIYRAVMWDDRPLPLIGDIRIFG